MVREEVTASRLIGSRLSAAIVAATLLAGCGGGSSAPALTAPSGTTITATFSTQSTSSMPTAVAVSTGGAWTATTLNGSSISFTVPSANSPYGLAYVCGASSTASSSVHIVQATAADATAVNGSCQTPPPTTALQVAFDASQVPGASCDIISMANADTISVYNGGSSGEPAPNGTAAIFLPAGTYDTLQMAFVSQNGSAPYNCAGQNTPPLAVRLDHAVSLSPTSTTVLHALTSSDAPSFQTVHGTSSFAGVGYQTAAGGRFGLGVVGPIGTYAVIPAAEQQSGDFYIGTSSDGQGDAGQQTSTTPPTSLTVPVPPAWVMPPPTAGAAPTFNVAYSGFTLQGSRTYSAQLQVRSATSGAPTWFEQAFVSAAYLGGSTSWTIPDLSSVAGFPAAPAAGSSATYIVTAEAYDQLGRGTVLVPNEQTQIAQSSGTFTMSASSIRRHASR